MRILKWLGCFIKSIDGTPGHDDMMFDVVFTPGEGERVVLSRNGKFLAAGKLNHWSTEYEKKLQYKLTICKNCGRAIYKEFPRDVRL